MQGAIIATNAGTCELCRQTMEIFATVKENSYYFLDSIFILLIL
jgi:hypothetical protein